VGGEHDRDAALAQRPDAVPQEQARLRVEVVRGLIKEQDIGVVHQGAGEQHALGEAAGQEVDPVPRPVGQPQLPEQAGGTLLPATAGHAVIRGVEREDLA
jgi:hypothetical protein